MSRISFSELARPYCLHSSNPAHLKWKLHISSPAKTISMQLGILGHLTPPLTAKVVQGLIHLCMEYSSHV